MKALESHFVCDGITKEKKVRLAQSRMKGENLTWWNFIQEERVKEGKNMITPWKVMYNMIRDTYLA